MRRLLLALLLCSFLGGCGSDFDDGGLAGSGSFNSGTSTTGGTTGGTTTGGGPAPVANNDAFTTLGNARVTFPTAQGLLTNDTVNGGSLTTGTFTTGQGGSVTISSDGSFVYTPARGVKGTDTFTYTVTNSTGSSTATATFTIPKLVWFVDNTAALGGDGTLVTPYNSFSPANSATTAQSSPTTDDADIIFVFRGNGSNTGLSNSGGTLKDGVNVIGEAEGLMSDVEIVAAGTHPRTTLQLRPSDNNTIAGLSFENAGANNHAVFTDQDQNITLRNNIFVAEGTVSVLIVDMLGSVNIINNRFETISGSARAIQGRNGPNVANGTISYDVTGNTFEAKNGPVAGGNAVELTGARNFAITANFDQNMVLGSNNGKWAKFFDFRKDAAGPAPWNFDATFSNLTCNQVAGDAIDIVNTGAGKVKLTLDQSTLANIDGNGLNLAGDSSSETTLIVTGSSINSGLRPVAFESTGNAASRNAIRLLNSTFNAAAPVESRLRALGSSQLCLDATGNTFTNTMLLEQVGTAVFQVEQLTTISALNNSSTVSTAGTVTNVADNSCTF